MDEVNLLDRLDELVQYFWHVLDNAIAGFEVEQQLVAEILLENDDNNALNLENVPADLYDLLPNILELVVGEAMRFEMLEMDVLEDVEEEVGLVYLRNVRNIDWRLHLPRMEYMRSLEDPQFKQHFRMDRVTFEALIVVIGQHLTDRGRLIRLRTPIDQCLLMALWILFNLDTFRSAATVFGVTPGIVHFHYLVVIEAVRELAQRFIKWPSAEERDMIKRIVYNKTKFAGFVAAKDGILVRCYAPAIQRERYFDRHQAYSINVQAICDHRMLYRDIYVGQPGSVNDRRVFQRSPIHNLLLESEDLVRRDEHIVADGGYDCLEKVLSPFRNLGYLTPRQLLFNHILSSIRMVIERSFGLLRSKFRRLLKLHIKRFEYLIDHIVASMVLHNFIILGGRDAEGICILQLPQNADPRDFEYDDEDLDEDDDEDNQVEVEQANEAQPGGRGRFQHPLLGASKAAGVRKREEIADHLLQARGQNL